MTSGYLNLTAFPDTKADAKTNPWLHAVMRMAAQTVSLPDRALEICTECGSTVINFMARDHTEPNIIFGGSICSNNDCTVLYICVSEGDD